MAKDTKPPPPFHFGEPEKPNWLAILLFWVFVIIAIAGIVWMVADNSPQHALSCRPSGSGLWSSFGRCVEQ